ncbi:MAG TPA: ribonuclease Y [Opitutales bacterium]|nr:ribonuclease Y [Opitutales bacterium]
MDTVWAILFSALLGAVFTAFLVWVLTTRSRKLDQERSKATLYYASKEAELTAREIRNKAELEIEKKWTELRNTETRTTLELEQRQAEIEQQKKLLAEEQAALDAKKERFEHESASLRRGRQRVGRMIRTYRSLMEEVGKMSAEEIRTNLFAQVQQECEDEIRHFRRELLERSDNEVEMEARKILITAMQRVSSGPNSDAIAAMIDISNAEMKGRIIGREGRNIKCFEATTGTTIMIDESPDSLLISCFDPVRREVAKIALEALIADGRIHPTSIEEAISKAREQVDAEVIRYGEEAIDQLGLTGVHHEILTVLGRLKYRFSFNQNVLDHSIEVAFLSSMLAAELGLDPVIAKRAGLFHDIGKAVDQEYEGSHAAIGAELLRRHGEPQAIVNAVAAHHEEVPAETPYAGLLIAADTLSATRPGVRAETQKNYLLRLERLEQLASTLPGVEQAYAIQAGREIRVIVSPDAIQDEDARKLARTIRMKIEEELQYPSVIKVTVIREQRFVETAK